MRGIAEFTIHGRVGFDAELGHLANGTARCRTAVCANIPKRVNETWEHHPVWFNVTWFGKTAEGIKDKLKKGVVVVIRGDISTYEQDVNGTKVIRYNFRPRVTSIVNGDGPSAQNGNDYQTRSPSQRPPAPAPAPAPRQAALPSEPAPAPAAPPVQAPAPAVTPPLATQPAPPPSDEFGDDPFGDDDLPF